MNLAFRDTLHDSHCTLREVVRSLRSYADAFYMTGNDVMARSLLSLAKRVEGVVKDQLKAWEDALDEDLKSINDRDRQLLNAITQREAP